MERIEEDGTVTHVTLRVGDGVVFLGHPGDAYLNPLHLRQRCEAAARMYEVPWIVDAQLERARAAGAHVLSEPEDTPHERQCRVENPERHRWMFQDRA